MRKFLLLGLGVALATSVVAGCFGGGGPPPTDPRDVLVVGDSVSYSFGCALGDTLPGVDPANCPQSPDYSAKNFSVGACTIYPANALLYNGGSAPVPNCNTAPAGSEQRTWSQAADYYVPKVVIINTGGWDIVDRWLGDIVGPPNSQWGGNTNTQEYSNAAVYFSAALYNAITDFRNHGAKVVVAYQPYANPPQPEPPPGGSTPPGLECSWWEPDPPAPPVAQGNGNLNPLTCPGPWQSPCCGVTYRSGHAKFDQFNMIVNQVLTNPDPRFGFGSDPNVSSFNFKRHFNLPSIAGGGYSDYVCPPPNDGVVAPDPITHKCAITNPQATVVDAILARAPDRGHLSIAGQFDILKPYLDPCVRFLLGKSGGNQADCG